MGEGPPPQPTPPPPVAPPSSSAVAVPDEEEIYSCIQQMHAICRFAPGCLVVSMIYVERLRRASGAEMLASTWQPTLLAALILAQKARAGCGRGRSQTAPLPAAPPLSPPPHQPRGTPRSVRRRPVPRALRCGRTRRTTGGTPTTRSSTRPSPVISSDSSSNDAPIHELIACE